ncbi:MAG: M20 family metallopeptidase [Nitrososphaerota archaeon]
MAGHELEGFISRIGSTLVRINTENPPGRELEAASYLADRLAELGLRVRVLDHGGGRGSVLGILDSGVSGPVLMLNSHLDTVPAGAVDEWPFHPFESGVVDGVLRGRGSVDAKGCLTAMLAALKIMSPPRRGRLVFAGVADEEVGGLGTAKVAKLLDRVDYSVFGEPTDLTPLTGNRGRCEIEIEVRGRPAHASTPSKGVNAISAAARIVAGLSRLEKGFGRRHRLMGRNTDAVTMISGGLKSNVVPDKCSITVDVRTVPETDLDDAVKAVGKTVSRYAGSAKASLSVKSYLPPAWTDENSKLVKSAVKALRSLGIVRRPSALKATTDFSRLLKYHRSEGLILGPGDLSLAHTFREEVPVKELILAARAYALIAEDILTSS